MKRPSLKGLFRDARVIALAVVVSSVLLAEPAMAAYDAVNADTVDGRDAIGARAKPVKRVGKLVAANRTGYLPNNIIRKAPNSARLDGKTRAAFVQRTSDVGELQTGVWAVNGTGNSMGAGSVRFVESLQQDVPLAGVVVVNPGESTVECPHPGEAGGQGVLCLYITKSVSVTGLQTRNPADGTRGASTEGVVILANFDAAGYVYGTWAVRSDG